MNYYINMAAIVDFWQDSLTPSSASIQSAPKLIWWKEDKFSLPQPQIGLDEAFCIKDNSYSTKK